MNVNTAFSLSSVRAGFLFLLVLLSGSSRTSSVVRAFSAERSSVGNIRLSSTARVRLPHDLASSRMTTVVTAMSMVPWKKTNRLSTTTTTTRLKQSSTPFFVGTERQQPNKIAVKPRPRVLLDRETGKITQVESTGSSSPPKNDGAARKPWRAVKQTLYSTVDAVKSIQPPKIARSNKKPTTLSRTVDGYSSRTLEDKTSLQQSSSLASSPGSVLMTKYQDAETAREESPPTTTTSSDHLFDTFKERLYRTADTISNLVNSQQQDDAASATPPPLKLETFKPAVKRSPLVASSAVGSAASVQTSPGKRWLAQYKITNWEEQQRRRKRELERREAAEQFKEAAYSFGDAVLAFLTLLAELPSLVKRGTETTVDAMATIPSVVETSMETMASIPQQVQANVRQVQDTVESGVERTKKTVQQVRDLPTKISQTVEDTRATVEETVTSVKILVGAEEKRPVPPQVPPPKPRTAQELALDVAGGVATLAGKAAWFVTVGVAKLSFAAAKLAVGKLSETMAEQQQQQQQPRYQQTATSAVLVEPTVVEETRGETQKMTTASSTRKDSSQPDSTKEESKEDLDRQVSEALLLAEKAMKLADEDIGRNKKKKGKHQKSELDRALQKAREAAVMATQQAVEIEQQQNDNNSS